MVGGDGSCFGGSSLVHHLAPSGEENRKDTPRYCLEPRAFVCVPGNLVVDFNCRADERMVSRTGIVAAIKTTYIKGSDLENDFTCWLAIFLVKLGDHD